MNDSQLETIKAYDKSAGDFLQTIAKLDNYNETYDYMVSKCTGTISILDLACGPANISKYILERLKASVTGFDLSEEMLKLAKKNIPEGNFQVQSIIDFKTEQTFDLIINGFGIPYLDDDQVSSCFSACSTSCKPGGLMYLSFMDGTSRGYETPSFNKDVQLYIFYHDKNKIIRELNETGFDVIKSWELDYREADGSITKDIIFAAQKRA